MFRPQVIVIFICIAFCLNANLFAQCIATSANSGATVSENTSLGTISWANPNGALTSDNSRATANALILGNVSHYMFVTDFGFTLPTTAIICGIEAEIERSATGLFQNVTDNSVRLIKGGAVVGNNQAAAGTWPSSDAYRTYGGAADLWGTTWTYNDINSANFGIAIAATLNGIAVLPSARIDHVRITVHYMDVLPIELLSCTAQPMSEVSVGIFWETASESENDYFTIEISQDGTHWEILDKIDGAGNSSSRLTYEYYHQNRNSGTSYYRLSQTDFDGTSTILKTMSVFLDPQALFFYPNPVNNIGYIQSPKGIKEVAVYQSTGSFILRKEFYEPVKSIDLDLSDLPAGIYLLMLTDLNGEVELIKFVKN